MGAFGPIVVYTSPVTSRMIFMQQYLNGMERLHLHRDLHFFVVAVWEMNTLRLADTGPSALVVCSDRAILNLAIQWKYTTIGRNDQRDIFEQPSYLPICSDSRDSINWSIKRRTCSWIFVSKTLSDIHIEACSIGPPARIFTTLSLFVYLAWMFCFTNTSCFILGRHRHIVD